MSDTPSFESLARAVAERLGIVGLNDRGQAGAHESLGESRLDFAFRVVTAMRTKRHLLVDAWDNLEGWCANFTEANSGNDVHDVVGEQSDPATAILLAACRALGIEVEA